MLFHLKLFPLSSLFQGAQINFKTHLFSFLIGSLCYFPDVTPHLSPSRMQLFRDAESGVIIFPSSEAMLFPCCFLFGVRDDRSCVAHRI